MCNHFFQPLFASNGSADKMLMQQHKLLIVGYSALSQVIFSDFVILAFVAHITSQSTGFKKNAINLLSIFFPAFILLCNEPAGLIRHLLAAFIYDATFNTHCTQYVFAS